MNFGSTNWLNKKKQKTKKARNTINVTIFSQCLYFIYGGPWYDIFIILFQSNASSTTFSQQILCGKLLLVFNWDNHFKLCIKKKKQNKTKQHTKNQQKKIVHEIVNFCSPNLTKPKKNSRNTTKCYNIFTILLFSTVVSFGLIYYYLFYRNSIFIIFS